MYPFPYKRIVVVGTTGSGKSTLAKQLADKLDYAFIELDALHWEPGWHEAPEEVFRERIHRATQAEAWVVAGNYHVVRDLVWSRSETVIWLDYPFWLILRQLAQRTFLRWWRQEELWNGNHEQFWIQFKLWSDESLIKWLFKTYWRRKKEYPILFSLPEYRHLKLIQLTNPSETKRWLESL